MPANKQSKGPPRLDGYNPKYGTDVVSTVMNILVEGKI